MVLNWQTFLQWFIVPSYHIMITYPLWRCHFFWLTLQIRKRWAATVDHQYLHAGVKLVSCSFLKSFICISSCIGQVFRELDFQSRGPWFKIAGWLQGWLSTIPEVISTYWFSSVEAVELHPQKLVIKFFFGKYHPTSKCVKNEALIPLKHSLGTNRKLRSDGNGQILLIWQEIIQY